MNVCSWQGANDGSAQHVERRELPLPGGWDPPFGLALSGGGYRASLYALGGLLYLVDAHVNRRVSVISSVSGSSISSVYVATHCDYAEVEADQFEPIARDLATTITSHGLVHSTWLSRAFVYVLLLGSLAVAATVLAGVPFDLAWPLDLVLLGVVGVVAALRGTVLEHAIGAAFCHAGARQATLSDRARQCDHVVCSTDLMSARPYFFVASNARAYVVSDPGLGPYNWMDHDDVLARTAVRASAAYPGGLPPRALTWQGDRVLLCDGGVSNNLGTQWWETMGPTRASLNTAPDRLLPQDVAVLNATTPIGWARRWPFRIPWIAEVASVQRCLAILYRNTVRPRLWNLAEQSRRHREDPVRVAGQQVAVSISDPIGHFARYVLSNSAAQEESPERHREGATSSSAATRAETWCTAIDGPWDEDGVTPYYLLGLHSVAAAVPTTLSRLDTETAIDLMHLGYLHTMEIGHVAFGMPILPLPKRHQFLRFVNSSSTSTEHWPGSGYVIESVGTQ